MATVVALHEDPRRSVVCGHERQLVDLQILRGSYGRRLVIFPWLAFGHLLPYLELSERLASRGHRVSFVSTPRNIARLPPLRPASAAVVDIVALPLPRVDGLPEGAESTNDVPDHLRDLHWKAFDGLAAPFEEFLAAACADEATRPHWIIADSFHHFVAASAVHHKVPCALLLPTAASLVAFSTLQTSEDGELAAAVDGQAPAVSSLRRYERDDLASSFNSHGSSDMSVLRRYTLTVEKCAIAAIRSCPEWEPGCFEQVAKIIGKPVVPLGLLPPSADGGRRTAGANREDATVRWLDAQPPNSVVYIALGSEVPLRVELIHELALGLELAGARFLWALRNPPGVHDGDILPPGFQDRAGGHGMVTTGWVPQASILEHAAVGAFLTHCGRNSLIESLLFGLPLVMLPIFGDQGPNARFMARREVGVQVERNEDDGSFDRHGVASAVRAVMVEEESRRVFVQNAVKLQKVVADEELHERYIDELVQNLRSYAAPTVNDDDQ